jgi:hypothetical protein
VAALLERAARPPGGPNGADAAADFLLGWLG